MADGNCADHTMHAAMLGHVADYCPECGHAFCPGVDGFALLGNNAHSSKGGCMYLVKIGAQYLTVDGSFSDAQRDALRFADAAAADAAVVQHSPRRVKLKAARGVIDGSSNG